MRAMRYFSAGGSFSGLCSFVCVLLCGSLVYGDICSVSWWQQNPSGVAVERELRGGANATARCPNSRDGDYPIHLAVLYGSADALRVLMGAGANIYVENGPGNTAFDLFVGRYESGRVTSDLDEMARLMGVRTEALNAGQNLLCDVSFWRNPSESAVLEALRNGADPNARCGDEFGNRPVHIALSSFPSHPPY